MMPENENKYQWILDTYPDTITKEQLYKICHVSKRTAQHYLVNGIIPCINTGKKTRQYTIRTADVVAFLQKRDHDPDICLAPYGWYKANAREYHPRVHSPAVQQKLSTALERILQEYPDVLTSFQAAEITGYHHETVVRWCSKGQIEYFHIRRNYLIPKVCLLEYLTDSRCHSINETAKEHILSYAQQLSENGLPQLSLSIAMQT